MRAKSGRVSDAIRTQRAWLARATASVYDQRMRSFAVLCRLSALALAALLVACASPKQLPVEPPAAEAAAPATPEAAEPEAPPRIVGRLHAEPIEHIDSTQRVHIESAQRCGPRITRSLPPPSTLGRMAGWVGLGGPSEGEVPAPDFHTEVVCTDTAVRRYAPAAYRVTYHVGAEAHSVDVPERPGRTIEVDETGQPAPVPLPAATPRQP